MPLWVEISPLMSYIGNCVFFSPKYVWTFEFMNFLMSAIDLFLYFLTTNQILGAIYDFYWLKHFGLTNWDQDE